MAKTIYNISDWSAGVKYVDFEFDENGNIIVDGNMVYGNDLDEFNLDNEDDKEQKKMEDKTNGGSDKEKSNNKNDKEDIDGDGPDSIDDDFEDGDDFDNESDDKSDMSKAMGDDLDLDNPSSNNKSKNKPSKEDIQKSMNAMKDIIDNGTEEEKQKLKDMLKKASGRDADSDIDMEDILNDMTPEELEQLAKDMQDIDDFAGDDSNDDQENKKQNQSKNQQNNNSSQQQQNNNQQNSNNNSNGGGDEEQKSQKRKPSPYTKYKGKNGKEYMFDPVKKKFVPYDADVVASRKKGGK